ncbi:MAG: hypothetical protein Kow00124_24320 [Anaerolineae bacterium]
MAVYRAARPLAAALLIGLLVAALVACKPRAMPVEEVYIEQPPVEEAVAVEEPGPDVLRGDEPRIEEPRPEEPRIEEPRIEEPGGEQRSWIARNWPWVVGAAALLFLALAGQGGSATATATATSAAGTTSTSATVQVEPPSDRAKLEREAREEEPPEECQEGRRYTRKRQIKVNLKVAAVDKIILATEGGRRLTNTVGGAVVDVLNRLIQKRRAGQSVDAGEAAQLLVAAIRGWLPADAPHNRVHVSAQIKGSKITYEFTLLRCQGPGAARVWIKELEWQHTVEESYTEAIGVLQTVGPLAAAAPRDLEALLRLLLADFIERF